MTEGYLLTGQDRDKIQKLIGDSKSFQIQFKDPISNNGSPEIYIAKPHKNSEDNVDGIPALIPKGEDTYDHPGCAACDVYIIVDGSGSEDWDLMPISGFSLQVYNLTNSNLGNDWLLVSRDKSGRWIAQRTSPSSSFRVAKITSVNTQDPPTQGEADGYALLLDDIADNLNSGAASLSEVTDPGLEVSATTLEGIADDTSDMIGDPGHVAEQLASRINVLQGYLDVAQSLIDAHNQNIATGGDGTLTPEELTDYNSIVSVCTSSIEVVVGVASSLADHAGGDGTAVIYKRTEYGALVGVGESVEVYCELLEGSTITAGSLVYIAQASDDKIYRIIAVACANVTGAY